jgi:predicted DNA-binding protein
MMMSDKERDMAGSRLTVRVNSELKKRLARIARQKARRASDLIREALELYCQSQEKPVSCLDIAKKVGLVGIWKNAPPDLSTNAKYMEGFGKSR